MGRILDDTSVRVLGREEVGEVEDLVVPVTGLSSEHCPLQRLRNATTSWE